MNFLTVEEFANILKLSPGSVRRSIREGKIFACRPTGSKRGPLRISESEIERLHLKGMCESKQHD